jgi:hypothetical protein
MKSFVYERGGGRAAAMRSLLLPVLSCFFAMLIPHSSAAQIAQPGIKLSYSHAMNDTFFTNERYAHPWYVMPRGNGKGAIFPVDDSLVDIDVPEYRKRPVSGKCVTRVKMEGFAYSDTSWTVMDNAVLKDDTLIMEFTIQQPPYIDVIRFKLHNGKITHEFNLSPPIFQPSKKEAAEYPTHLKLVSLDMTINLHEYKKGDMLLAKMKFTLLDTWAKRSSNIIEYEGWLRCKVE